MTSVLRDENIASATKDNAWNAQRVLQTLRKLCANLMLVLLGFAFLLAWQVRRAMLMPLLTAGSIAGLLGARSVIFRTK